MISYVSALFVKGLAYVDFSDDAHLEAAVAKNKQELLGKRLFIARSDPSGRNRGKQKTSKENGMHCYTLYNCLVFVCVFLSYIYLYYNWHQWDPWQMNSVYWEGSVLFVGGVCVLGLGKKREK